MQVKQEELTRTSSDSGADVTGNFTPRLPGAANAEKPLLSIYLPGFRPPSLNELLSQHWTGRLKSKKVCSELVDRAASALREAMGQPDRLTAIICWGPVKRSGTQSRRKS